MWNNSWVEVKGVGTCQLGMRGGWTLILHDVLFAPDIQQNLVSVIVLMQFGYALNFYGTCLNVFFGKTFYGSGYLLDGFIVMDVDNISYYNNNSFPFSHLPIFLIMMWIFGMLDLVT